MDSGKYEIICDPLGRKVEVGSVITYPARTGSSGAWTNIATVTDVVPSYPRPKLKVHVTHSDGTPVSYNRTLKRSDKVVVILK